MRGVCRRLRRALGVPLEEGRLVVALFNGRSKTLLGLDIGASSVKLLELSRKGDRQRVESHAVEPLPPNAVADRNVNDVEGVGEAIRRARRRAGSRTKQAVVAVAGPAVIAKTIELEAAMSDLDMERRIAAEADRYIPYPLDEVAMDFEVQGLSERNPDKAEVLLAACRKEHVESRAAALRAGGLKPAVVDLEQHALERAFALLKPLARQADEWVAAVVDLGATITGLCVLADGQAVFAQEQLFGGRQLTEAIQRRYSLSFEEAELAKKEGGLPENYQETLLGPFQEAALQQLSRSLAFFFSTSRYNELDCVVLAGGGAALAGLADVLKEGLGAPALLADPFADMELAREVDPQALAADAPSLLTCCGLALRRFA